MKQKFEQANLLSLGGVSKYSEMLSLTNWEKYETLGACKKKMDGESWLHQ